MGRSLFISGVVGDPIHNPEVMRSSARVSELRSKRSD